MATIAEDRFIDTKQWFTTLFGLYENTLNGRKSRPFHSLRRAAIERIGELNFPTRRDEDWKYTSVTRLLQPKYKDPEVERLNAAQIEPFHFEGLEGNVLVFVNGHYDASLSTRRPLPEGVALLSMEEAMESDEYRPMVEQYLNQWARQEDNPFVVLNTAFARDGVFIHVPKGVAVTEPIHLLNVTVPGADPLLISPQSLVIAERNSELTLLDTFHALEREGEPYFTNAVNCFVVKEGANLRHYKLQQESTTGYQINNTLAYQDKDSTYSNLAVDLGGKVVRNNLSAILKESGTTTNMYAAFLGNGEQHIDHQTFMDHAVPHCQSNELYKGILTDRARGVFNGKVMVRPDAQKTNAFQQNSTLVLSDTAVMDTKPQLEIFADDVRCSHGATIGQLDEDSVFYLRSRGLSDKEARTLLQQAFLREVLDFIEIDTVREKIDRLMVEKF